MKKVLIFVQFRASSDFMLNCVKNFFPWKYAKISTNKVLDERNFVTFCWVRSLKICGDVWLRFTEVWSRFTKTADICAEICHSVKMGENGRLNGGNTAWSDPCLWHHLIPYIFDNRMCEWSQVWQPNPAFEPIKRGPRITPWCGRVGAVNCYFVGDLERNDVGLSSA